MEAQSIRIALHDESAGYPVSPARVSLGVLRSFAKDVDELLRGDAGDLPARELEVAIVAGSLAIETRPTANPGLLRDLHLLAASELIDSMNPKRRSVVERWQKAARSSRPLRYEISAAWLAKPVVISAETDFHMDDADQWVRVERYVQGEVFELGGLNMMAGELASALGRDPGDPRDAVKDDLKLLAQAVCTAIPYVLTEDERTLAKFARQLEAAGRSTVKAVLLRDGFDLAWFNNGQRGLPGT